MSVSTVSTGPRHYRRSPGSIISSDSDIRFTRKKLSSQYRCGCCIIACFLLLLLLAAAAVYVGCKYYKPLPLWRNAAEEGECPLMKRMLEIFGKLIKHKVHVSVNWISTQMIPKEMGIINLYCWYRRAIQEMQLWLRANWFMWSDCRTLWVFQLERCRILSICML